MSKEFIVKSFYKILLVLVLTNQTLCQVEDWLKLVPLKSNRKEVEKILGKPDKYLQTYGTYSTSLGKFSVWYAAGGCKKKIEGRQWNVPAQKLTKVLLSLKEWLPLETYIKNKDEYKRETVRGSGMDHRAFYFSPDESTIFQTITIENNIEYVEMIGLEPSKDKKYLLCKK